MFTPFIFRSQSIVSFSASATIKKKERAKWASLSDAALDLEPFAVVPVHVDSAPRRVFLIIHHSDPLAEPGSEAEGL